MADKENSALPASYFLNTGKINMKCKCCLLFDKTKIK